MPRVSQWFCNFLYVAVSLTYEQLLHPLQTGKYHLDTGEETLYFNFDQKSDIEINSEIQNIKNFPIIN